MWICAHSVILPTDCFEIHIIHMFNKRAFAIKIFYDLSSIYTYNYTWGDKLLLHGLGSIHNTNCFICGSM